MASPYQLGSKNAIALFDGFADGDVIIGATSFPATTTTVTVTWSGSGTPDFVISSRAENTAQATWTANTTAVTFTRAGTTTGAEVISYIIGNLS